MRLYHGSNTEIKAIGFAKCKPYKDFGQGFYLTEIEEQATQMARRTASIYGGEAVVTQKYDIVIGPVADDTIATLFRNFEDGVIDLPMLANGLKYKKISSQYFFHTPQAVAYLKKL